MAYGAIWDAVSASSLATRPSVYVNFESAPPALARDLGGRMAFVAAADFGPVESAFDIIAVSDIERYLGAVDTDLTRALKEAFYQGASRITFYRVAGTGGVAAHHTFNDGAGTPAPAIVVTAKYAGTYGNQIKGEIVTNAADDTKKDLNIYVGTTKVATYSGATAAGVIADWTSQEAHGVPVNSSPVTLAVGTSPGTNVPANVTATALASGVNGADPVAQDYVDALDAVSSLDFRTIAFDTTDAGIQATIGGWVASERDAGHRIMAVLAPASDDTWSDKKTQAAALDTEGVVYVANGYVNKDGVSLDPVWAAAADAAMIAAFGTRSVTYAVAVGATGVVGGLTSLQYGEGLTQGIFIHSWDGEKVKVEQGLNTLQAGSQVAPKSRDWRKIRFIAIQDDFVRRAGRQLGDNFIGQVANDDRGRAEAVRQVRQIADQMVAESLFDAGTPPVVELHPGYVSDGDSVFIRVEAKIVDAVEKLFLTMRV